MSALIIKGIDFPKNGEDYFFSFDSDGKLYITNYNTGEEIIPEEVVEIIVPHGRLIDASALDLSRPKTFGEMVWEIENAPTILEAEI